MGGLVPLGHEPSLPAPNDGRITGQGARAVRLDREKGTSMQHSVGRRLSRRAKGAVLTLIAGAGLVLTGVAQADTTNPATIWVPANSTRTAQGTFDDPLVHVDPALSCPTQQADPAQTVPNCVHTIAVVQLGPGGQADMVVRVTADENQASRSPIQAVT